MIVETNRRISIESPSQSKDASGGNVTAWGSLTGTIWAAVKNMSGNERRVTTHGGQVSEARTEFTIRYIAGITTKMRISYSGAYYNITHVNNFNEANRWLVITCDTGVNDG